MASISLLSDDLKSSDRLLTDRRVAEAEASTGPVAGATPEFWEKEEQNE